MLNENKIQQEYHGFRIQLDRMQAISVRMNETAEKMYNNLKIVRQRNLEAPKRKQYVEEYDTKAWIRFNHSGTHATCAFCTGAKHIKGMSQKKRSKWVLDGVNLAEMDARDRSKAIDKHSKRPSHVLAVQHQKSQMTLWDANSFKSQKSYMTIQTRRK